MLPETTTWDWNVAVFCRNERWAIARCIESIANAGRARRTLVTLIVNGSSDDSAALALEAARKHEVALSVFAIPYGDKANAINQFFYTLREPARAYFSVDAYVTIGPAALGALEACLAQQSNAVAATGAAVNGRTMVQHLEATLNHGARFHGQLHALRPEFIDRLTARKIRLPIGLYYGDGLLGSMAMHDLDPLRVEWDQTRIAGSPAATYQIPMFSPFRVRDLRRQLQRKVRQMRGRLENLAIRGIVYRDGYEGLPEYADDMVNSFLS